MRATAAAGAAAAIASCLTVAACGGGSDSRDTQSTRPDKPAVAAETRPGAAGARPAAAAPGPTAPVRAGDRDCAHWYLPRRAQFSQSNGWDVYFDLGLVQGYFEGPVRAYPRYGGRMLRGQVKGNVERTPRYRGHPQGVYVSAPVNFSITWSNGSIGIYTGTISTTGWARGTAWDMRNPASKAAWGMHPDAVCSWYAGG